MLKKIFYLIVPILIFILIFNSSAYALSIIEYFKNGGSNNGSLPSNLPDFRDQLLGALKYTGYGVALIFILITGIQFLTANPQRKAQLKERLWLILIGVIILAGGIPLYCMIWDMIHDNFW